MLTHTKLYKITTLFTLAAALTFTGCSSSTGSGNDAQVEVYTAADVPANPNAERGAAPDFTFYSLADNEIVDDADSASTNWDLGFNATTIIVNGGTSGPGEGAGIVLDQSFEATDVAPSADLVVDTDTSYAIDDWYNYDFQTHVITPIENKTIVVRTGDGEHYAKIRILSYYEGNPEPGTEEFDNASSRYYTFEYAIQLDGSTELN